MARFATTLDSAVRIPFTGIRFGLDALLGLIPGVGDLLTTLMSLSIVYRGWRLGASTSTVLAMLGNVGVDFLAGVVPVAGDVVDVFWRSNKRNIALLRNEFAEPESGADGDPAPGTDTGQR